MNRLTARYWMVLAVVTLAACDSHPQTPTPLPPLQATAPPTTPNPANYPLAGSYALTLTIGSACTVLPEAERTRNYTANIGYASDGRYVVTLSDATFLTGLICTGGSRHFSGIGCQQFFASEDIDEASFFLENNNDEAHGGHIVERLSSGTWVEIIASASGRFNPSSIEASGTGSVWYCRTPLSYPFPCPNFVSCGSADMRLMFRRK